MFENPAIQMVLVSAIFAVISQVVQLVVGKRHEMRKTQKAMREKNKEFKELMKKGESHKTETERVQREMLDLSTQSMKNMPKLMIVNMIVFLPLFGYVSQAYEGTKVPLFFPLNLVWGAQGDWFWFYVLCSFLISMIVNQVLNAYDENKEKKKGMTITHAQ